MDAAIVTQIWDFKRADLNHIREPAGDGICQNKKVNVKGVPAVMRAESPSVRTCSGTHICVFCGEMDISVLSKQRVCQLLQLARGHCHGHRWSVTTYSPLPCSPSFTPCHPLSPISNTQQYLFGYLHLHAPLTAPRWLLTACDSALPQQQQ